MTYSQPQKKCRIAHPMLCHFQYDRHTARMLPMLTVQPALLLLSLAIEDFLAEQLASLGVTHHTPEPLSAVGLALRVWRLFTLSQHELVNLVQNLLSDCGANLGHMFLRLGCFINITPSNLIVKPERFSRNSHRKWD